MTPILLAFEEEQCHWLCPKTAVVAKQNHSSCVLSLSLSSACICPRFSVITNVHSAVAGPMSPSGCLSERLTPSWLPSNVKCLHLGVVVVGGGRLQTTAVRYVVWELLSRGVWGMREKSFWFLLTFCLAVCFTVSPFWLSREADGS